MKLKLKPKIPKIKKKKRTNSSSLLDTEIRTQMGKAVDRYLEAIGKHGLFPRRRIYERPWYLICGAEGSGKTALLTDSGLDLSISYPTETEGYIASSGSKPLLMWQFTREAVWIKMAGSVMDDTSQEKLAAILHSLHDTRPKRPLDGIILVFNLEEIVAADNLAIKNIAKEFRRRIDLFIGILGIELPVYLIFSHTDTLTGFNTFFSDESGKWDEGVLGSVLHSQSEKMLPRYVFLEKFREILDSIHDIRLKMLVREKDPASRRNICQFPIHIEGLREKISILIAMLFRPGSFEGKPHLTGFFFTSCQRSGTPTLDDSQDSFSINDTIAGHPLNPKTIKSTTKPVVKSQSRSFFVKSLLQKIIPEHQLPVLTTVKRHRQARWQLYTKIGIISLLAIVFLWLIWGAAAQVKRRETIMLLDLAKPVTVSPKGIRQLGKLEKHYQKAQFHAKTIKTFPMIVTWYNAERFYGAVRHAYFSALYTLLVQPCSTSVYNQLSYMIRLAENNPQNNFIELKNTLQTYLSISKTGNTFEHVRDSQIVIPHIKAIVKEVIYKGNDIDPEDKEILDRCIKSYFSLLQTHTWPRLIKANSALIDKVRLKLVNLFDVDAVYEIVTGRRINQTPKMYLHDIITQNADLLFKTKESISEMYTPKGWNNYLIKEITEASRRLDNIDDWVVGDYKNKISSTFTNAKKLQLGMMKRYFEDVEFVWRRFFMTLTLDEFRSLDESKTRLLQLSSDNSTISLLLDQFSKWSSAFELPDSSDECMLIWQNFTDKMSFLNRFTTTNLTQYQKKLENIALGLTKVMDNKSLVSIFNGREGDPLVDAYQHTHSLVIPTMNEMEKAFLKSILLAPLFRTIDAGKKPLRDELNKVWRNWVYTPFNNTFSGRYPFIDTENEAIFEVTLQFFKPDEGNFWRIYEQTIAPFLEREGKKWRNRNLPGMIPLSLTSDLKKCLTHADKIATIFYGPDKKSRVWKFAFQPRKNRLRKAEIKIGEISADLLGEGGVAFVWPGEGAAQTVKMNFTDIQGNFGTNEFLGPWALMRLMNTHRYLPGTNPFVTRFDLTWNVKAHAKQLSLPMTVSISNQNHPFGENPFFGFKVPEIIAK